MKPKLTTILAVAAVFAILTVTNVCVTFAQSATAYKIGIVDVQKVMDEYKKRAVEVGKLESEYRAEEQKLDNIEIYVRQNGFVGEVPVEKLDELLSGAKAGETKKISTEVPKTYFREEYRGKKVDVQITIKDIKWLKPAELDENFLKRFEAEDENDLREKVRDTLQSRLEQQVRTEMTEQIYKYLLTIRILICPWTSLQIIQRHC